MNLIITPKTKVLAVLAAYPHLEAELISFVPAFEKLRNPVLRNTVARVASLQQAAAVGGVTVEALVNRLRKAVGQDTVEGLSDTAYCTVRPVWAEDAAAASVLDAKELLDRGEQPVDTALSALADLPPGRLYRVRAPFVPAPLIDKATSLGLDHWLDQKPDGTAEVWFRRASSIARN